MKKIIRKMDNYLQSRNYLSEGQDGFRGKRSGIINPQDFYDKVSSGLDIGDRWMDCVFWTARRHSRHPTQEVYKKVRFSSKHNRGTLSVDQMF